MHKQRHQLTNDYSSIILGYVIVLSHHLKENI
jgi:hypothetical protein